MVNDHASQSETSSRKKKKHKKVMMISMNEKRLSFNNMLLIITGFVSLSFSVVLIANRKKTVFTSDEVLTRLDMQTRCGNDLAA